MDLKFEMTNIDVIPNDSTKFRHPNQSECNGHVLYATLAY